MNKIIVTLKERRNLFSYDVELPLNIKVEQLKYHIVETIQALDTNVFEGTVKYSLFCERLGRTLVDDETLEEAGVWNGDYLLI